MKSENKGRPSAVWPPFTPLKTGTAPLRVKSGKGVMLTLEDGRHLMDCISSWWVNLHGHTHPEIAQAIHRQALELEQVIFAGLTHEPAERLAHRLVDLLPEGLTRVFYSDNGSTAVEVALKMAFQYWKNRGASGRTRFISFEGAYHGDTLGAMSVSHRSVFTDAFRDLLFDVDFIPYPETFEDDADVAEKEARSLAALERLLASHAGAYAALIIEPLVQGAGGMRMCRPAFLKALQKKSRDYDILIIYDEVMVGFGRTGDYFACRRAKTVPDIICLSKGITGGFMPLAATVCTDRIHHAFYDEDPGKTLYHGHSYTANPLGCAAANVSLDLLIENHHQFEQMAQWHRDGIDMLRQEKRLQRFRVCGTIAAMDVAAGDGGYLSALGPLLRQRFMDNGFLLRPLGNVIYILPPYCIRREELLSVYECIRDVISKIPLD
jgi:adenosylmethionine-8-amino-7-oxononanoate aminotransferase